ncbi:hypothetical protein ACLSYX_09640 [[Pasteurella] aerogenes]
MKKATSLVLKNGFCLTILNVIQVFWNVGKVIMYGISSILILIGVIYFVIGESGWGLIILGFLTFIVAVLFDVIVIVVFPKWKNYIRTNFSR